MPPLVSARSQLVLGFLRDEQLRRQRRQAFLVSGRWTGFKWPRDLSARPETVHRTVEPSEPGTYRVEDMPRPVHGTFWIGSESSIVVRTTMAEVKVPLAAGDRSRAGLRAWRVT